MTTIPFVNLKAQYQSLKTEMDRAIQTVLDETAFIGGKHVAKFELEYASAYGVKHCISCGNGTDAIYIAMKALGIGPGDEVITTSLTWIATAETISQIGAKPVFIDIEPEYYTLDAEKIEAAITPRTKAIIPVHLYGQAAEMDKIQNLCSKYNLHLIEDCAQSHFAEYKGKKVGTFGIIGTFSFYPGKNLGCYGDGGAIITNDDKLAAQMKMFANHGALTKHQHEIPGINSRLDGLQAAVLSVKLPHISDWNRKRHAKALLYQKHLSDIPGIILPKLRPEANHVFHLYVIRVERREELQKYLKEQGIETQIHYPVGLPFMNAFKDLGGQPQDFPVISRVQNEILSLPIYPELTEQDILRVAETLRTFQSSYLQKQ